MRVFLDANVLFSASQPDSVFSRLIAAARAHGSVASSELACLEARRNLMLRRPTWTGTFEVLLEQADIVPSAVFPLSARLDEKDVPLLCAAIHAHSQFFVTGDRRTFGHLYDTTLREVTVITPLRLAEHLAAHTRVLRS